MTQNLIGLYKENTFYKQWHQIPQQIEWITQYSLINFEDYFGMHASIIFLDPNMCGFWYICMLSSSPNCSGQLAELVVNIIPLV